MKLKHLLAVALMAIGGSAWAQTDVTSTYLVNPSFELKAEGTASTAAGLSNNGTYYGWQLPNLGASYVNISIGSSTECAGQAFGATAAAEGSYYYYNRRGWNSSASADATLSTTSKAALPAGKYVLSVKYKGMEKYNSGNNNQKSFGSNITLKVILGGGVIASATAPNISALNNKDNATGITNQAWETASVTFYVTTEAEATFNIVEHLIGGVRSDIVIDDVKLLYTAANANDYTTSIVNPSFESGNTNGWTVNSKATGDTGSRANNNATYTMDSADGMYLFNTWNGSAVSGGFYVKQTIEGLPMGLYELSATVASDNGNTVTLVANDAESDLATTDKATGVPGSVQVQVIGDLVIGAQSESWFKADNFQLIKVRDLTAAEIEEARIPSAKASLKSAIEAAPAVPTVNVGEGAFKYSSTSISDFEDALATAQKVLDKAEATLAEVNDQIDAVKALALPALNAPTSGQRFHLNLKSKGTTTFVVSPSAQSGYSITFNATESNNYPQAFELIPVAGAAENDMYTISFTDNNGETRYICNGIPYSAGTGAYGIRTITDSEKALVVKVVATATEGEYNLLNTSIDGGYKKLGSNGGDFYTDDKYSTFTFSEASEIAGPSISAAGYATYVAPVDAAVPTGAKAYTVENVENDILVMAEVETTIPANTAVILEGSEVAAQGLGYAKINPANATVTTGLLKGTYSQIDAPNESYVLQKIEEKVGFYQVDTEVATPKVGANRCYLEVPSSSANVRAFFFGGETAISAVEALTSGKAEIYNINGVKINKLEKGINIVNGKKIMVK